MRLPQGPPPLALKDLVSESRHSLRKLAREWLQMVGNTAVSSTSRHSFSACQPIAESGVSAFARPRLMTKTLGEAPTPSSPPKKNVVVVLAFRTVVA